MTQPRPDNLRLIFPFKFLSCTSAGRQKARAISIAADAKDLNNQYKTNNKTENDSCQHIVF
jgi:hypothetical protein